MKSLKEISWQVPESTYRQDPALSYSVLSRFEREGFDKLGSLFEPISTPSLLLGSVVDTLITGTKEDFDSEYFVADFASVGEKEKLIADSLFTAYGKQFDTMESLPYNLVLQAISSVSFQPNWKEETRVRVIRERCAGYYATLSHSEGKKVVDRPTFYKAMAMVRALHDSHATSGYFADDVEEFLVRRFYQLKFKATFGDVDYRCMADLLVVDYDKKIVYPVDLKTSGHHEWHFPESFLTWRYDLQARLYWRIIRDNMDRDGFFKDFLLADYRFVVVNKESLTPLVWEFPLTRSYGVLADDKGNEYRDPFVIGKELHGYLYDRPQVPLGISVDGVNSLDCLKTKLFPPADFHEAEKPAG